MAVLNITSLNGKAREHTEWAVAWLEANDIPAAIEQRGSHPSFVIERFGNKRRVSFAGSPSVITPNAVFRDVRIAALELGYTETVDREGRPVNAFADALLPKPKVDPNQIVLKGLIAPQMPKQWFGKEKRSLAGDVEYLEFVKERTKFIVAARDRGAKPREIHTALVAAGNDVTDGVVYIALRDAETGQTYQERRKEREAAGTVKVRGETKIPTTTKRIPVVTINAIALLIEEAAKVKCRDLIMVRDNLKKDADAYDGMRAALKKGGGQLESLLAALAE